MWSSDAGKSKHRKVPALKGWTQITPKQSQDLLATRKFDGHRFFIFLTGDETGLFVIDIDRKNPDRPDHACKIDGVEAFEMWCGPIETPDTFTSKSIGGGYHKVYRLTKQLANCIQNGQPVDAVLCEILHNKRGFMYGEGCKMIHRMLPQPPPAAVSNLIINNYFNTQVNIGSVNHTVVDAPGDALGAERQRGAGLRRGLEDDQERTRTPTCWSRTPTSAAWTSRWSTTRRGTATCTCTATRWCSTASATASGCWAGSRARACGSCSSPTRAPASRG